MAAGGSIRISLLLQISAFSLLLLATEGNKDVHYPYTVYTADSLPSHPLDIVDLSHNHVRLRRQVVSTGNTSAPSPSPESVTGSPSPIVTQPSSTSSQASISGSSSTQTASSSSVAQPVSTTPPSSSPSTKSTTVKKTTPPPSPANTTAPDVGPTTPEAESTTVIEVEKQNNHSYYVSRVMEEAEGSGQYWVDDTMWEGGRKHGTLSDSHRTAATVDLTFKFLFYGHEVTKVTVATGGFLYMSPFLHQWLTATQYVAPLMANFDTGIGNNSHVRYMDNGTAFIVWWEDVYLQDNSQAGKFSFQALLHIDGRIIFSYKQVALAIDRIPTAQHPVKVGLSDAYYIDQSAGGRNVQRRTIYEYHRVEINKHSIANNSAVVITPLPSCITLKTCEDCASADIGFNCQWCPRLRRCSDGLDRQRQLWLSNECSTNNVATSGDCPGDIGPQDKPQKSGKKKEFPVGAVVAVILVIFFLLMAVGWFVYAYKNPHSKSGQWLIEHRPSNIRNRLSQVRFWKRGDSGEKYEVSMQPDGGESIA